jgi:alpha-L-rhamnosidase
MPVHWVGSMISPAEDFDGAPVLRKDIALQTGHGDLRSAELHVSLGNGWFRGRLTWSGARALYADRLGVIGQLEMGYADGHRQVLVSDETWTAGPSAVLANDLYDGQTIDARRFDDTWARPGAAPAGWVDVEALEFDTGLLTPYIGPPVTRQTSCGRWTSSPRRRGARW